MTRGRPALWSTVFGAPLLAVGLYVYRFRSSVRLFGRALEADPSAGLPIAVLGAFVIALGAYVQFVVTPEPLAMREGERKLQTRTPALRHTLAQIAVGLAVLLVGAYLFFYTDRPYLYPTAALAVGLYVFSAGLYRYWRNTLTRYVVTDRRVVEEYWFLSLIRNEVPFEKVRGVGEHRSAWEALFGVGGVAVRTGADGTLTVSIDDVYESGELAEVIREQIEGVDADDEANEDADGDDGPDATEDDDAATVGDAEDDAVGGDETAGEDATPADSDDGDGDDADEAGAEPPTTDAGG